MKYILLALALIILGCNSTSIDGAPETFDSNSENGLAIGTITFAEDVPVNDIYRFFYEPTSGDNKFKRKNNGKVLINARKSSRNGSSGGFNNGKTYLFVIELEPGTYAFNQYNYLNHIGYTGMVTSSKKFAVPFAAEKGSIHYIGELNYYDKAEPGSPKIIISDKFERDIEQFRSKFPNINWNAALNKTVLSGDTGEGIIDFE